MAVAKITSPIGANELINKTNEIIDALGTSGGGAWGTITGTLSDQTDLQNALDSKQNASTAVTHTASTAVGNSTVPVYIATDGKATTCAALNTAAYVADNTLVHLAGAETITGNKTFSGTVSLGSSATATTPTSSDNSTKVATTKFVKDQGYQANVIETVKVNGTAQAVSSKTVDITVPIISDTYSATSTDGMSGIAVASAISQVGGNAMRVTDYTK